MSKINTVCVYCGSGPGTDPRFIEAATAFGATLARRGVGLVYGGGSIGLMGAVATASLDHGGRVTGIIPDFLTARENALKRAQELIVTNNMHERKQLMFDRSDAFVALPGGIGTLEELVEQLTWAQLGRHTKPILLANIAGFWDPLLVLIRHMRDKAFIRQNLSVEVLTADRVEDILPKLEAAAALEPEATKHMEANVASGL
ncbi:lysine decarboxylase [Afipia sp. Root123D2]|uniref:LOG family protein n=1 Tax=Afipia sp. Root123D2 TaxID=1736436 RepID=UPI0006F2F71C|nr:TIGR00730 family Rossman fold protein [Afipia sp. Root123D2]KQW23375.1 lysine decarboxylase [Afipia sp. Root123D2]